MDQIIEFLKTYYREIIDISVLLISVVLCLVRKRPCVNKMDAIKQDALEWLPLFINLAEKDGHGAEKKSTVLSMTINFLEKKYGCELSVLTSFLSEAIESILSTPKKKGE